MCTQHVDQMRSFHKLSVGDEDLHAEVTAAIYATGAKGQAAAIRAGEVWGRVRNAAKGLLPVDDKGLVPVRRNPDLWELKWKLGRLGQFRMYHAEPGGDPAMVGLVFHRKDVPGADADEIEQLQNREMDRAGKLYGEWVNVLWGHQSKCCTHCVADIESGL